MTIPKKIDKMIDIILRNVYIIYGGQTNNLKFVKKLKKVLVKIPKIRYTVIVIYKWACSSAG